MVVLISMLRLAAYVVNLGVGREPERPAEAPSATVEGVADMARRGEMNSAQG